MSIIDFIRLVRKHIVLLIITPLLLGALVAILTSKPRFQWSSQTVLYTGLATGSSIEMDKSFNYFLTNTAFDNLLNIINSRETQQEVAIRLLSQHLMLQQADPKYISSKSLQELRAITPAYLYQYVAQPGSVSVADSTVDSTSAIAANDNPGIAELFPSNIDKAAYEATVSNLTALMQSSDTNFVYKLLNYEDPHYSIEAISSVKATRMANSDLIKLTYEVDDPGICQQTLAIFNEVCIKNYKLIKENRSDEVVKYFEAQLAQASATLKTAEDKLLAFNKSNNIINYYEQSKAVAVVKEDMEVDYSNKRAQLAGQEAAIRRLEEKLNVQQQVQLKSSSVLDKKKLLGDLNYEIAAREADAEANPSAAEPLPALRKQAESLKNEIRSSVDELYSYQNTVDGLPIGKVLNEWINNVVEAENLKAKLKVMDQRNGEFQQQYAVYAPAGANIKRIEREISVSEQGYLEILHGLNLAKLKLQDNAMAANLKMVDPPYYPLNPTPTKRKVLVIAAAVLGGLLTLGIILLMEYFDDTIRNARNAAAKLGIAPLGMFPKVMLHPQVTNMAFIENRMLEMMAQKIAQRQSILSKESAPKLILLVSTTVGEGKTVMAGNLAAKLSSMGQRTLVMLPEVTAPAHKPGKRFPVLHRLLGYADPRIDRNSKILANPATYLQPHTFQTYEIGDSYFTAARYTDLLSSTASVKNNSFDFVIVELPALLYHNYPATLVAKADEVIVVCRANRIWSAADQEVMEALPVNEDSILQCIVNGVGIDAVEASIGELPKKRTYLRRSIKNLVRMQFFTHQQI